MSALKLARLPDRNPVKLTISVLPDLNEQLLAYASAYKAAYGVDEPVAELVPAMLTAFLESDREFAKRRKAGA